MHRIVRCDSYDEKANKKDTWYEVHVQKGRLFWKYWEAVGVYSAAYRCSTPIPTKFKTHNEAKSYMTSAGFERAGRVIKEIVE